MHTLKLERAEVTRVLAALYAVSPVGGGSDTFTLLRKISEQTGVPSTGDLFDHLLQAYTKQVVDDYYEATETPKPSGYENMWHNPPPHPKAE